MKKGIWKLLVTLFVCMNLLSVTVFAEGESQSYGIQVGGIKVTDTNVADVLGDGTVSYDADTNTLTLCDAEISLNENGYGINTEGALNIILTGENKLISSDLCGIHTAGDLTINGDGSLEAAGSDFGIYSKGNLTIGDNVNVDASCGDITSGNNYGIRVGWNLTICGNAVVTAKTGKAPAYSYAIYTDNDLTICEDAVVTAEAGYGLERSCGLYAISNLYISDNAVVNATGMDNNESEDVYNDSYGIRTTHMYVNGGSLTAIGGCSNAGSNGIFTQDLEISGGTVTAKSSNTDRGPSTGIDATKTLTISGGTVNAAGGDAESDSSCGIRAANGMTVTGGTIEAVSGSGEFTYGIQTQSLTANGGKINAEAKNAGNFSSGIQLQGPLTVSNSMISTTGGDASGFSYGLQAEKMDISDSILNVVGGKNENANGIWSFMDVNIVDSDITVTAGASGINASFGSVKIDCTEVKAVSTDSELKGTRVIVSAGGSYGIYADGEMVISELLTIDAPEGGKLLKQASGEDSDFWTVADGGNNIAKEIKIVPNGYYVLITGLDTESRIEVPAGQTVNATYNEICGVNDFSELLNTEKAGHTFIGWYTDKSCTDGNEFSFDNDPITEDISIYPKWERNEPDPGETSAEVLEVYNAFVLMEKALKDKNTEKLEAAVEGFSAVVDTFNAFGDEELAELAELLGVEDGEAAKKLILSTWDEAKEAAKPEEDNDDDDKTPSTGDDSKAMLWLGIAVAAGIAVVGLLIVKFKKRG